MWMQFNGFWRAYLHTTHTQQTHTPHTQRDFYDTSYKNDYNKKPTAMWNLNFKSKHAANLAITLFFFFRIFAALQLSSSPAFLCFASMRRQLQLSFPHCWLLLVVVIIVCSCYCYCCCRCFCSFDSIHYVATPLPEFPLKNCNLWKKKMAMKFIKIVACVKIKVSKHNFKSHLCAEKIRSVSINVYILLNLLRYLSRLTDSIINIQFFQLGKYIYMSLSLHMECSIINISVIEIVFLSVIHIVW